MQCEWIKKNGEQCKANAKEGEKYCAAHLRLAKAAAEESSEVEETTPQEPDMASIHNNLKKHKIRFVGKGSYAIPAEGVAFNRKGQVEEVNHETWKRLLESQSDAFEEV